MIKSLNDLFLCSLPLLRGAYRLERDFALFFDITAHGLMSHWDKELICR